MIFSCRAIGLTLSVMLMGLVISTNTAFANNHEESPAWDRQVWKATKYLLKKGFTPYAAYWLTHYNGKQFKRLFGVSLEAMDKRASGKRFQYYFDLYIDVETGKIIPNGYSAPFKHALAIPLCYRNATPWKDCALKYHQITGELMTPKERVKCQNPKSRYFDECWARGKGDLIMLPTKETKPGIDLSTARKVVVPNKTPVMDWDSTTK